jgi:prepilin-type N-terminal cleavage/methylation domain-containing protein
MRKRASGGFTLLEVLVSMTLLAVAGTALVAAFGASGQLGVLARRQATAVALARSLAAQLALADYGDARIANSNPANDASIADAAASFARATLPTGTDAPDATLPLVNAAGESYEVYVNVKPDLDATGAEQGKDFAVIVRYRVGTAWARAVVLGYRYNPASIGVAGMPM